jgi:hypothetical protein
LRFLRERGRFPTNVDLILGFACLPQAQPPPFDLRNPGMSRWQL